MDVGSSRREIVLFGNISGIILHKEHTARLRAAMRPLYFVALVSILLDITAGSEHG
jgi:hypothetical protein